MLRDVSIKYIKPYPKQPMKQTAWNVHKTLPYADIKTHLVP